MWRTNAEAWFLVEWINLALGPSFKKYIQEYNLHLKDDLREEFKFIKVLYLPSNTTPMLQVISTSKKLHTNHIFRRCFEVMENTLPFESS